MVMLLRNIIMIVENAVVLDTFMPIRDTVMLHGVMLVRDSLMEVKNTNIPV